MRSRHWHQLDHILVNSKAKVFVKVTKASLTADYFTDHILLICKCQISAVKKKDNSKPPKKFDTTMIKERKETLQRFFQEKLLNAEADWKQLKSVLSDAAKHVLGKKENKKLHYLRDKVR